MSYKLKSLIYFIGFLASCIIYYYLDADIAQPEPINYFEVLKESNDTLQKEEKSINLYETTEKT